MLGLSLIINGLCPFLLYRVLESHFPAGGVMPLLYASMFPALGSILGNVRKGTVDVIAMIVMAALAMHIVVTLIARNVGITLVAISLDGTLIGLVLIVSAMVRRPRDRYRPIHCPGRTRNGVHRPRWLGNSGHLPLSQLD